MKYYNSGVQVWRNGEPAAEYIVKLHSVKEAKRLVDLLNAYEERLLSFIRAQAFSLPADQASTGIPEFLRTKQ